VYVESLDEKIILKLNFGKPAVRLDYVNPVFGVLKLRIIFQRKLLLFCKCDWRMEKIA
jgi:hypothetical protein